MRSSAPSTSGPATRSGSGCRARRSRRRGGERTSLPRSRIWSLFAEDTNRLLRVLDTQDQAVSRFVKNTGVVFNALSERQGQLRGLIQNSATVFATTAQRDDELRETFRVLPTFLEESRLTLNRLESFSANANPLITQLRPSGPEISGTLRQVARVTPDLKGFFDGFLRLAATRSRACRPCRRC